MASRKTPLADNPNAANSPYRGPIASKRARAFTNDLENECSPPKKKLLLELPANATRISTRSVDDHASATAAKGLPPRQPNTFTRRLLAERDARHAPQQQQLQQQQQQQQQQREQHVIEKVPRAANTEEILQSWKRHYRRQFPLYVLYFESLQPDVAFRYGKQSIGLGARVEKFFSKDVTHVITTRPVPPTASCTDKSAAARNAQSRVDTIDPSVLNKPDAPARTRNAVDAALRRETRVPVSNDVLHKAREMNIKIWSLEKFERMVSALTSDDASDEDADKPRRAATHSLVPAKRERDADLSQLLRNERNNAPIDRKPWQEIIPFRGVFIYIHDMDERTKPVMVREYNKPLQKEDGKWPMLRSVSKGRCPFIEEQPQVSREDADDKARLKAELTAQAARRTRARAQERQAAVQAAKEPSQTREVTKSPQKPALQEAGAAANRMPKPNLPASLVRSVDAPKLHRQTSGSTGDMPPMLGSTHASYNGLPRKPGGEPLASGMQANITSAIRSQMYSSTAPSGPGQRVGMTKQQHQMSRRILEKQSGLSNNSLPSSFNVNDVRAAINKDQAAGTGRMTRVRAAEKLDKIHEDETHSEDEGTGGAEEAPRPSTATKRKQPVKRDPKPGYCENCRDKYDDFHTHIASKTHRRFALTNENFADLDKLLKVLIRK